MPTEQATRLITCTTCSQQSEVPAVPHDGPALFGCWKCQTIHELHPDGSLHPLGAVKPPAETLEKMRELIARTHEALKGRTGIVPFVEVERITTPLATELGLIASLETEVLYIDFDPNTSCLHCVVSSLIERQGEARGTIDATETVKKLMTVVGNVIGCAEKPEERDALAKAAQLWLHRFIDLTISKLAKDRQKPH